MAIQQTFNQYVEIGLGNERFALPIQEIREIIKLQPIIEIPNTPTSLLGVINLRGNVIPIVNIHSYLGMPKVPDTKMNRIIIVNYEQSMVGIVVDQVIQVTSYSQIEPLPYGAQVHDGRHANQVANVQGELINIISIEQIL